MKTNFVMGTFHPRQNHYACLSYGYVYDEDGDQYGIIPRNSRSGHPVYIYRDDNELCQVAHNDAGKCGCVAYSATTMRDLLFSYAGIAHEEGITENDMEEVGWIVDYAIAYGWETMLYRADAVYGEDYQPNYVSELEACIAWLTHDGDKIVMVRDATDEELEEYFREEEEE